MSIFIECRNKDAEIKQANGDWTTILGENITINSGDQLYIKNSFIDTQEATNQKINVSQDTILTLTYGFYKLYRESWGMTGYGIPQPAIDYNLWTTCWKTQIPNPDPQQHHLYKSTTARVENQSVNGGNSKAVPKVLYEYEDWEGNIQTGSFSILPLSKTQTQSIGAIQNIGSRGNINFTPSLATLGSEYNVVLEFTVDDNLAGKNVALPLTYTKNITIPKGAYDPDDICEVINDAMANNSNPDSPYSVEYGGILNDAEQIMKTRFSAGGAKTNDLLLIGATDNIMEYDVSANYPAGDNLWVGSSQFEISYNQATKKFEFSVLHFPYYYQKSLAVEYGLNGAFTYVINKNGGIFLTQLSSNGDDLWNELGFPETHTSLYPVFTWNEIADPVAGGQQLIIPHGNLADSVNITGGATTLDAVVDKDDADQNKPWGSQPIASTISPSDNNAIEGQTSILDKADNFGYFIVEIGHKLKNEFYTPTNNYRNFQQVVSKYYVQNSYTTGSSDGSLIYTHNGQPTLLESFQCRILNSDKELAENIGEDNTIHIVLVRAEQPQK